MPKIPPKRLLTKSQYLRGLQCAKSLWLYSHMPELRSEISPKAQNRFDKGTEVGILARSYFPGGVLIPHDGVNLTEQIELTQTAIKNAAEIIYEAAFCADDVFLKADILRKTPAGWEIYEVKSSTKLKDIYINDIALQDHVLRRTGLKTAGAYIMYINNEYVRQGDIDVKKLFLMKNVSAEINTLKSFTAKKIEAIQKIVQGGMPETDIGVHCSDPYDCDFSGYCWRHIPSPSVFDFGRIRKKKAFKFYNQGILRMEDAPPAELTDNELMQLESWKSKESYVNLPQLRSFLDSLKYPLAFMDFETFFTAIPLYDGIRAYQQVPFQYSLHVLDSEGAALKHYEYLADASVNPQREFMESLLNDIPQKATILVLHKSFEEKRLKELIESFPEKKDRIQQLLDNIVDLEVPFQQRYIYFPDFHGSSSIKKILPNMVESLSYEPLAINNGTTATASWLEMRHKTNDEEKETLRKNLLEYCCLDTYAIVKILEKMRQISSSWDES